MLLKVSKIANNLKQSIHNILIFKYKFKILKTVGFFRDNKLIRRRKYTLISTVKVKHSYRRTFQARKLISVLGRCYVTVWTISANAIECLTSCWNDWYTIVESGG